MINNVESQIKHNLMR